MRRETSESSIDLSIDLDGTGTSDIETGVPFYDHLLTAFAKHSLTDLTVRASGDVDIDVHHTVEDTGIVLGQAIRQALGDKRGISRYGDALVPLDEALAQAVVDISGRPFLVHSGEPAGFEYHLIGGHFTGSMVRHVFEAITFNAGLTVHVTVLGGRDPHHIAEAEFKAFARAFRQAKSLDPLVVGHPVHEGRPVSRTPRVVLLDYGSGNVHSAAKALEAAGAEVEVTADRTAALEADGLVVPGVGAFKAVVDQLRAVRGDEIIDRRLAGGRPVLGICVGMQVMFEHGVERGIDTEGLGEWPGVVTELPAPVLPHMGWNTVDARRGIRAVRRHRRRAVLLRALLRRAAVVARRDAAVPRAEAHVGRARRAVPRRGRERTPVGHAVPPREVRGGRHPPARRTGSARSTECADVRACHTGASPIVRATKIL